MINKRLTAFLITLSLFFVNIPIFAIDYDENGNPITEIITGSGETNTLVEKPKDEVDTSIDNKGNDDSNFENKIKSSIFSDVPETLLSMAMLLNSLGILTGSNGKFEPDKKINCNEFIDATIKFSKDKYTKQDFIDTFIKINNLIEFKGEETVTLTQAASFMAKIMKFDVSRPDDFSLYMIAVENKLLNDIPIDGVIELNKGAFAQLLFNSLISYPFVIDRVKGGNPVYSRSEQSYLENNYNIYHSDGLVTGTYETLLRDSNSDLHENEITIDDIKFDSSMVDEISFLGQRVDYFYRYDSNIDNQPFLVSIRPKKKYSDKNYKSIVFKRR